MSDLDQVLRYLERSWMPPDVKAAYDRLCRGQRYAPDWTGLGYGMVPKPDGSYLKIAGDEEGR